MDRIRDALTWVAQEARGVKMSGVPLPHGSRLREALDALDAAYRAEDAYTPPELTTDSVSSDREGGAS